MGIIRFLFCTFEFMKNLVLIIVLIFLVSSCGSKKSLIKKNLDQRLTSAFYENQFTGVLVIDANSKDTIYNLNDHKYFTPASNTKIFTLFTAIRTLPDQIPALQYIDRNDTLYFEGTGDPSFLHPYLKDSTAFKFLKSKRNLVFATDNFMDTKFGPGWAWDDYQYYYSPERNAFPLYGNVVMIHKNTSLSVSPTYFKDSILQIRNTKNRKETSNLFFYPPNYADTIEIPFITNTLNTKAILEQALNKPILNRSKMSIGTKQTLPGIQADSLYIRMMHESDNFIA